MAFKFSSWQAQSKYILMSVPHVSLAISPVTETQEKKILGVNKFTNFYFFPFDVISLSFMSFMKCECKFLKQGNSTNNGTAIKKL